MKRLIILLVFTLITFNSMACEEPHAFLRAGAGYTGSFSGNEKEAWDNHGDLGAQIDLGFRWPIDQWALDVRVGHHSNWFASGSTEANLDYLNIGLEYRWF